MGAEWYCQISGRALGPFHARQLKSMAAAGQLEPTDLVRKGVSGGWAPAADVQGLFGAGSSRSLPVAKPLDGEAPASQPVAPFPAVPSAKPPVAPGRRVPPPAPPRPGTLAPGNPTLPDVGSALFGPAVSQPDTRLRTGRRHNNAPLLAGLAVLAGVAVTAGVAYFALRDDEPHEPSSREGASTTDGLTREFTEFLTPEPAGPESTLPGGRDDRPQNAADLGDWTDASKGSIKRGNVEVRIRSVKIGSPPKPLGSRREVLLVAVELRNTSASKTIEYRPWGGKVLLELPVALSDNLGNRYRQRFFNTDENQESVEELPEARVIDVTDDSFDAEVLQAPEPVLVDFWAAWCPHCPPMTAICERVAAANAGRVKVVKVNVDNCRQTASRYGIRGVPTVILFHGGEVAEAYPGGRPEAALQAAIHTLIPPPEIPAETLDPQEVVEELLGFERPAAEAEFLRIELPGGAIGTPGTLDFLIPRQMIDAALRAS